MTPRENPARTLSWWVMVYAFAVTPLDFDQVGLTRVAGPDVIKWGILFPVWYLPLALITPRWSALMDGIRRPPLSWLLAWATLGAISVLWAVDPKQALLIGLGVAGLVVLASWYAYDHGWYNFATAAATGLGLYLGAGVLFDLFHGQLISGAESGRAVGLSSGPTTFGRLGAVLVVLAASIISFNRSSQRPLVLPWLAMGTGFTVVVFAETRAAMLAVTVGLLYGGLRHLRPLDRWLIVGGLGTFLVAAFGVGAALSGLGELGQRNDPTSVSGRTEIWPLVFDIIAERPLLGYGAGAEETIFTALARDGLIDFLAFNTHSIVLSSLTSGGVVGFSFFVCAVGGAIRRRRRVNAWIPAVLITVLLNGLTESLVHRPTIAVLLISGTIAAIARVPRVALLSRDRTRSAYLGDARRGLAGRELQPLHR